jgi:hypothetical protein
MAPAQVPSECRWSVTELFDPPDEADREPGQPEFRTPTVPKKKRPVEAGRFIIGIAPTVAAQWSLSRRWLLEISAGCDHCLRTGERGHRAAFGHPFERIEGKLHLVFVNLGEKGERSLDVRVVPGRRDASALAELLIERHVRATLRWCWLKVPLICEKALRSEERSGADR